MPRQQETESMQTRKEDTVSERDAPPVKPMRVVTLQVVGAVSAALIVAAVGAGFALWQQVAVNNATTQLTAEGTTKQLGNIGADVKATNTLLQTLLVQSGKLESRQEALERRMDRIEDRRP